jgi:hypothetical protein
MWSASVNQSRLTCRQAGVYRVGAFLDWGTNTTGVRLAWLRTNGEWCDVVFGQRDCPDRARFPALM